MGSDEIVNEMEGADREAELRQALLTTQRQLARAKAKTADLVAAVFDAAKSAAMSYPPVPTINTPPRSRPGHHWDVLHATDLQLGKRTASYSSDVAEQRALLTVEKTLWLTDLQRKAIDIPSCALLLGGDMVEGVGIFPGQAHEVDSPLFDQLFRVASVIDRMVRTLLENFDHVEVWEEYGNHGRIGKPGEYPAGDNIDRVAYALARERVGQHERLIWHPSTSWYNHGKIGAYSFLLVHGDENRRIGAGSANSIQNQIKAYAAGAVEPFVDAYVGHWHRHDSLSLPSGGTVYLTGSPESGNEYARQHLGATGLPSQRLNIVDADEGRVVSEHRLWLDK